MKRKISARFARVLFLMVIFVLSGVNWRRRQRHMGRLLQRGWSVSSHWLLLRGYGGHRGLGWWVTASLWDRGDLALPPTFWPSCQFWVMSAYALLVSMGYSLNQSVKKQINAVLKCTHCTQHTGTTAGRCCRSSEQPTAICDLTQDAHNPLGERGRLIDGSAMQKVTKSSAVGPGSFRRGSDRKLRRFFPLRLTGPSLVSLLFHETTRL